MTDQRGRIVIVSGPSGAGKGTVLTQVKSKAPVPLVDSVSATTRQPRPGERDGQHYHFLSEEEFDRRRRAGEFLECFEVFGTGIWYGTLRSEVERGLRQGDWVVLEIDVQGAMAVRDEYDDAITIFIRPSSLDELESRLRQRGTETDEQIAERLRRAAEEITWAEKFQYQVINDDLPRAVRQFCDVLAREKE